jgi:hypothetical protein
MTSAQFIEKIRSYLQDTAGYNELLDDEEELSDSEIELSLNIELDYFNNIPPMSVTSTTEDFPAPYMLILGAAGRAILSASVRHDRNRLEFNDGGVSVRVNDKSQPYKIVADGLLREWREFVLKYKTAANLAAFDDVYFPMGSASSYYDL